METKLYVGNLSFDVTEDELRKLFSEVGTVSEAVLIKDRDTGYSKGFAFITMGSQEEAKKAIEQINGKMMNNRELKVNEARPPEDRSRGGYGNNRGGNFSNNNRNGGRDRGNRRY